MDETRPPPQQRFAGWMLVALLCVSVVGLSLWMLAGIFQAPVLGAAVILAAFLFGMPLMHYLLWGWWLGKRIRQQDGDEQNETGPS